MHYYKVSPHPKKPLVQLRITEESQIKDAIHDRTIFTASTVSFRNSKITDQSLGLLIGLEPLPLLHLNISENFSFISDASLETLSQCQLSLHSLNVADNQITDLGLKCIATAPSFAKLTELVLYGNTAITSQGISLLAHSLTLTSLQRLDIHATSVCDQGLGDYLDSPNAHALTHLNASMNWKRIGDQSLYALSQSPHCTKLENLWLQDCGVTDKGIEKLSESDNCRNLLELFLNNSANKSNNLISDRSVNSMAFSDSFKRLITLELRSTEITPKGLKTLAASQLCDSLKQLRLSHCKQLNDEAIHYLQAIIKQGTLQKLYVNSSGLSQSQIQQLEAKNPLIQIIY